MKKPPHQLLEFLYRYDAAIESLALGLRKRGTDLEDARGVLQGTGKAMRHIKLKALSELDRPEMRAFLRQARKRAGLSRLRPRTADAVVTRVKGKSPFTPGF